LEDIAREILGECCYVSIVVDEGWAFEGGLAHDDGEIVGDLVRGVGVAARDRSLRTVPSRNDEIIAKQAGGPKRKMAANQIIFCRRYSDEKHTAIAQMKATFRKKGNWRG